MLDFYRIISKFIFGILLLVAVITFFTRNNYRSVNNINAAVQSEPIQTEAENQEPIEFTKDDYKYNLTPIYDYEINGLIVQRMNYMWFSVYKTDSVFPSDVCMVWGSNAKNKIYKEESLKFSQDMRFCFAQWSSKTDFNMEEISNNHLVFKNEETEKKAKSLSRGDQVKIKGQLVNIEAKNIGKPGEYDPDFIKWESSISRNDAGAGACEVIYVDSIEILSKANSISHALFEFSFYSLLLLIIFNTILFFIAPIKKD